MTENEPRGEDVATDPPDGGDEDSGDRLSRWIPVTLAAIVLFGAALAIFQTRASTNESNTARETTRAAVGSLRGGVDENAAMRLEEDIAAERNSLVLRRPFASLSEPEAVTSSALARARAAVRVERAEQEIDKLSFNAERDSLKQAALAETRVTWNDRSTQYTTVIAVLAVALFLVGFSLAVKGRRRAAFYGLGLAVALLVVVWAAWIFSLSIPETSDEAIAATARGSVAVNGERYAQALAEYDRAVESDGDYAPAYTGRATARILADNPDLQRTGAVTGGSEEAAVAVADLRQALEVGADSDLLTFGILSLAAFYAGEYDRSVEAADEALVINDQVPDIWLLRSAAEVGRGDVAEARSSFLSGTQLLADAEPSRRTRDLVATYITYLEWLIANEPAVAEDAARLERQVVARETEFTLGREVSRTPPARGTVSIEGLRYRDGKLQMQIVWRDMPADTVLTALEFERPLRGGAWAQPPGAALFVTVSGSGRRVIAAPIERSCTPTEVRLDVYLNGAFAESATGPGDAPTCS